MQLKPWKGILGQRNFLSELTKVKFSAVTSSPPLQLPLARDGLWRDVRCNQIFQDEWVCDEIFDPCEVPLACGFKYGEQTSSYVNDRLLDHKRKVKINASNSVLAKHIGERNSWTAGCSKTKVLHKKSNDIKWIVRDRGMENCISNASMQVDSK